MYCSEERATQYVELGIEKYAKMFKGNTLMAAWYAYKMGGARTRHIKEDLPTIIEIHDRVMRGRRFYNRIIKGAKLIAQVLPKKLKKILPIKFHD